MFAPKISTVASSVGRRVCIDYDRFDGYEEYHLLKHIVSDPQYPHRKLYILFMRNLSWIITIKRIKLLGNKTNWLNRLKKEKERLKEFSSSVRETGEFPVELVECICEMSRELSRQYTMDILEMTRKVYTFVDLGREIESRFLKLMESVQSFSGDSRADTWEMEVREWRSWIMKEVLLERERWSVEERLRMLKDLIDAGSGLLGRHQIRGQSLCKDLCMSKEGNECGMEKAVRELEEMKKILNGIERLVFVEELWLNKGEESMVVILMDRMRECMTSLEGRLAKERKNHSRMQETAADEWGTVETYLRAKSIC